jgi:hypothetical protein
MFTLTKEEIVQLYILLLETHETTDTLVGTRLMISLKFNVDLFSLEQNIYENPIQIIVDPILAKKD